MEQISGIVQNLENPGSTIEENNTNLANEGKNNESNNQNLETQNNSTNPSDNNSKDLESTNSEANSSVTNDQILHFNIQPPQISDDQPAPRSHLYQQNSQNDNNSTETSTETPTETSIETPTDAFKQILNASFSNNENNDEKNENNDEKNENNDEKNENNKNDENNTNNENNNINDETIDDSKTNNQASNDNNNTESDQKMMKNINELSIDELKEMAYESQPILGLDLAKFQELIDTLIQERDEIGDNVTSDKYEVAIQHVRNYELVQQKVNLQQDALANYQIEIDSFNQELANYDYRTNEDLNAIQDNISKKRILMLTRHEMELDQHAEKWQSRNMLKLYNSASSKLLGLRKQLNNLKATGRFKEAHDLKLVIEKEEIYEGNEAIRKMQRDFEESLQKITKRHQREIKVFDENAFVKVETYKQNRTRKRQALMNKKAKLEKKGQIISDPEKLWNLNQMQRAEQNFGSTRTALKSRSCPNSARPTTTTSFMFENHLLEDVKTKEKNGPQTTIKLPPLNTRRKISKPN